jgi:hypothetical protein
MKISEILKHYRAVKRIVDTQARLLELTTRAKIVGKTVTPEYAEYLMDRHPEIIEFLEAVWLEGTRKRLVEKNTELV